MIEILVCTNDRSIGQAAATLLPPAEGVRWMLSCQYSSDEYLQHIPVELLNRKDTSLTILPGIGLSANRNHALQSATGDLLVLADSDVHFLPDTMTRIECAFSDDPSLDIAVFQVLSNDGTLMPPSTGTSFSYGNEPRGFWYRSMGIVIRRSSQMPAFDERFGLGSALFGCGEEEVFLHQAHMRGLNIRYIPQPIMQTDPVTTGSRLWAEASLQRAKGAVLTILHGRLGALLRCTKTVANSRQGLRMLPILYNMIVGIIRV